MWLALAFLSAFLLGCYEVNKKMSLNGNAVIPVLFFNTLISSLIFVPFILLSFYTDCLDGTMVYVPRASLEDHVKVLFISFPHRGRKRGFISPIINGSSSRSCLS